MAELTSGGSGRSRFYSELIGNTAIGQPVITSDDINTLTVGIIPAGGASGKVQYTLSPPSVVADGSGTWRDWPKGTVTATADDVITGPITAVRGVSVSGEITLEVVG